MPVVIWFLKTSHSKPVIFLVYAFKETDGENHSGEKPAEQHRPWFQPSWWHSRIHAGPQVASIWDQGFSSGPTGRGHLVIFAAPWERSRRCVSTFGHSLPGPVAWVPLVPTACSLLKVLTELSLTKSPVLWFIKAFSSCLTGLHRNLSALPPPPRITGP